MKNILEDVTKSLVQEALSKLYEAMERIETAQLYLDDEEDTEEAADKLNELYDQILDMTTDIEETFDISTEDK